MTQITKEQVKSLRGIHAIAQLGGPRPSLRALEALLSIAEQLAAGTHVVVPVEPTLTDSQVRAEMDAMQEKENARISNPEFLRSMIAASQTKKPQP